MGFEDPYPAHTPDQTRYRGRKEITRPVLFIPDATGDPASVIQAAESEREFQEWLDNVMEGRELTVKERYVFLMVVGCGHSERRTAWIMRSTKTTVHRWLCEAKRKMGITE